MYKKSALNFQKAVFKDNEPVPKSGLVDGLRKFHYEVTSSTNFRGWSLPLTFEFAEDIPSHFYDLLRDYRGNGRTIGISESAEPEGLFDLSLNQTVVDWRFRHDTKVVNAIIYKWTNAYVPPTNEPLLKAKFAARLKHAPYVSWIRKRRARTIFVLL